ncbi:MAG TPA: dTDP-glucose 4,6-dehydratase [Planctomycetes bacterium]|nr:dTDP-glucose 4,6-dehydratase [Planctomycetota bacterium]
MNREYKTLMVTGGAGFMGSNFIRYAFRTAGFKGRILNVDKLTYAGDKENLADLASESETGRYRLLQHDICDHEAMSRIVRDERVDGIVNFAAESHVDRSIAAAQAFGATNVLGTLTLLEAARAAWGDRRDVLFHQISTDEVYGSCPEPREFAEDDRYEPSSPYAASKAAADHMVRSFGVTHGFPYAITHATNNYGPYQTPEKLIPLVLTRLYAQETIPVYGKGDNVREWLFVDDHTSAVWTVITRGKAGESYNIGSGERLTNLDLIHGLGREVAARTGRAPDFFKALMKFVVDRPGHDKRYALNAEKLRRRLGWKPAVSFDQGLKATVAWYGQNEAWMARARTRLGNWLKAEGTAWAKRRS